jgi:hypothetical protein
MIFCRDLDLGAAADHARRGGAQVHQLAHRGGGARLDDLLHVLPDEHEGDDDRRDLEVDVPLIHRDGEHVGEEHH